MGVASDIKIPKTALIYQMDSMPVALSGDLIKVIRLWNFRIVILLITVKTLVIAFTAKALMLLRLSKSNLKNLQLRN